MVPRNDEQCLPEGAHLASMLNWVQTSEILYEECNDALRSPYPDAHSILISNATRTDGDWEGRCDLLHYI